MITRRTCSASIAAMAVSPWAASKPAAKGRRGPYRIGWLTPTDVPEPERLFRAAMGRLGYLEGRDVVYQSLSAQDDFGRLPALAAQLVKAGADVIVAVSPFAIVPARQASSTIPVVMAFWGGEGLMETGFVRSFARPGGSVTGISMLATELEGKRLELLLQAVPKARRVGVLWPTDDFDSPDVTRIARSMGVALRPIRGGDRGDRYEEAFAAAAAEHVDALLVPSFPKFFRDAARIIEQAATQRLPAIYEWPSMADMGGLIAYGPRLDALQARVADYVDRILKGARPGELPIEQPSSFELVVNQRTAKAIGLAISPSLLLRADRVIG